MGEAQIAGRSVRLPAGEGPALSALRGLAFASTAFGIAVLAVVGSAKANGTDLSGKIGGEGRVFPNNARYPEQSNSEVYSVYVQPELRYDARLGRLTMVGFYRHDSVDEERTHFDIRELNWRYFADRWDVLAGVGKVFWGVTESRHLVDIINQTDLVEDIDEESKLGQPMVRFNWLADWGSVTAFVLPGFRERTFPGPEGRLRPALPVSNDEAIYESSDEESHVDWALRYTHVIGNWDVGAHYFSGTGREPRLLPDASGEELIPHYDLIEQVGIDAQLTSGPWLWKFEGIRRHGQGDTFGAAVGGFEYTFYQIGGSSADLGVVGELLYDDRGERAPPTLKDRDVFVGLRLALNGINNTEALLGGMYDEEKGQQILRLEAERRLSQHWSIELEGWHFKESPREPLDFNQDDYVRLQLIRYL